eukprot:36834-Ditylum_brightwellii.AAC.1
MQKPNTATVRAYFVLVKTLSAEEKFHDAIQIGIEALTLLGNYLPFQLSDKPAIKEEFYRIKGIFESMTDDELLSSKTMEDSD